MINAFGSTPANSSMQRTLPRAAELWRQTLSVSTEAHRLLRLSRIVQTVAVGAECSAPAGARHH